MALQLPSAGRRSLGGGSLSLGALCHHVGHAASTWGPVWPTTSLPPGSPTELPNGRVRPLPRTVLPSFCLLGQRESKVSSLLSDGQQRGGPRAQASHLQLAQAPPASADSLCSLEAFGSSPVGCVINQPEFRQSALGKRNVWCALVFSSNCSMACSACKIFQNKAIDGNYISTLGTDGM